jgi:serine/threonine protein kinase
VSHRARNQRTLHASDVYGLGVLLFWSVAGRLPNPSRIEDARLANDGTGRAVKEVLARCLDHDPTARFQTAGEVAEAAEAIFGAKV